MEKPFLAVTGTGVFHETISKSEEGSSADLLARYFDARRRRDVRSAPHVEFANARTDDLLIAFVKKYGPVWADSTVPIASDPDSYGDDPDYGPEAYDADKVIAYQSLESARRHRTIFSDLVRLVATLTANDPAGTHRPAAGLKALQDLLEGPETGPILTPLKRYARRLFSRTFRPARDTRLDRSFRIFEEAHQAVCNELNGVSFHIVPFFDPEVNGWRTAVLPRVWANGIRPALYLMVREDYVRGRQLGVCARQTCASAFVLKRFRQRYCCRDCSLRQRQKEYWQRKGKSTRKRRRDA